MVLPAPFSPTSATTEPGCDREVDVVEHQLVGARIRERHVLEADAAAESSRAPACRRPRACAPRSPRARPGAARRRARCRAGSRSRRRSRRCSATAACRRPAPAAHRPATRAGRSATKTTAADVRAAEDRPAERVPGGGPPARGRDRPVPALPGLAPRRRADAARRASTRTSLPGGAVVPRRTGAAPGGCAARRVPRASARRPGATSTSSTVGSANSASSTSAGWIDASRTSVTTSRSTQPQVENSDMYMWSSTNTWSRSIASRSRYSGRSWCSIVATEACKLATCDSSAIVTRSRKRRCTRVRPARRNQVAAAQAPRPSAARSRSRAGRAARRRRAASSSSATSASGSAATQHERERHDEQPRLGPVAALERRHIDGIAGGRSSRVAAAHREHRGSSRSSSTSPKRDACSSNIVR